MAVGLPGSKLDITPRTSLARGYPILSGETADDLTLGIRGLTQQINYRYSLGRCLYCLDQWSAAGTLDHGDFFFATASTTYVAATGHITVTVGADIAGLTLVADVANMDVRLAIKSAGTSTGAGDSGYSTVTDSTLAVSGGSLTLRIEAKRNTAVSVTDSIIRRISVFESTMDAGDFP